MNNAWAQYLEGSSLGTLWTAPAGAGAGAACTGHEFSPQHHQKTKVVFLSVCLGLVWFFLAFKVK